MAQRLRGRTSKPSPTPTDRSSAKVEKQSSLVGRDDLALGALLQRFAGEVKESQHPGSSKYFLLFHQCFS